MAARAFFSFQRSCDFWKAQKGFAKSMLKKLFFEITNVCNLSCAFCPSTQRKPCFVEMRDFEKVLREARGLAERILLHVKGEPLLHPLFAEFIRLGEAMAARFEITSNGLLLEGREEALLSPCVAQINFSLHALLANGMENDSDKRDAILAFAQKAAMKRPDLYINFRLWDLDPNMGIPHEGILAELESRYGFQIRKVDVKQKKSFRLAGRTYLHFDTEFRWPSMQDPVIGLEGFCYGLKNQIAVLSNGVVTPCCLDAEGEMNLGSAFTETLYEILRSKRALEIQKNFANYRLSEELCRRCSYIRRFSLKTLKAQAKKSACIPSLPRN